MQTDGIALHEGGNLRPAKMNKGEDQWKQSEIRGDAIKWLDRTDAALRAQYPALWAALDALDALRAELDGACAFNSQKIQVQVCIHLPLSTLHNLSTLSTLSTLSPSLPLPSLSPLSPIPSPLPSFRLRCILQERDTCGTEMHLWARVTPPGELLLFTT